MTIDYFRQNLFRAIDTLATSVDPLATRLEHALSHLSRLDPSDVPDDLRGEFDEVMELATAEHPAEDAGKTARTLRTFSETELTGLAERIVGLLSMACEPVEREESSQSAPSAKSKRAWKK